MLKKSWLIVFSILLISCGKDAVQPDLGWDYYPLSRSTYRIYDVSLTTYVDTVETIESFQLRETITDSVLNGNEVSYLMRIERREDGQSQWRSIESIRVRRTMQILDYRENNKSFIKLSFPVKVGKVWDGNTLNQDSEALYSFENMTSEIPFDESNHIKVVISDLPPNIVEQDQRYEIYAQGIGLVERSFTQIQFCTQGCSGANEPEDGTILFQRLIEHGAL